MLGLGIETGHWIGIHDADSRAIALFQRHYSTQKRLGKRLARGMVGPGESMLLLTVACDALFIWRRQLSLEERQQRFGDVNHPAAKFHDAQGGILCQVFRNEGQVRSSDLILEADELACTRWPGQRLYTYVWDAKVKSVNPGYCFKKAGWSTCGRNADGRLTILEKWPNDN